MKRYIILILLSLFFLSCSKEKTAVLWSSNREAANIVELFNISESEYKIIFKFKEDLAASFLEAEKKPDIIIGEDLQNYNIKSALINLNYFFNKTSNEKNIINQALLNGSYFNNQLSLIPISYALTAVVFKKNTKKIDRTMASLELKQMQIYSAAFNNDNFKRKGFSPFWDNDFIYAFLSHYQSSFTATESQDLKWDKEKLATAMNILEEWNMSNGGSEIMRDFNNKYLYDNRIKILKEERILFTTMSTSEFMLLPDSANKDLDFLYISNQFNMNPIERIYAGINKKTNAAKPALAFLSWLLNIESQTLIIKSSINRKEGTFGLFGGFSSINSVNSDIFPLYYPRLRGKIPEPEYIMSNLERPFDFNTIKDELITSWVQKNINGENITLDESFEKWNKLRIPF